MTFDVVLKWGATGVCLYLAILSWRLLAEEQRQERPRKAILGACYGYMVFALLMALLAFTFQRSPETLRVVSAGSLNAAFRTGENLGYALAAAEANNPNTAAAKIMGAAQNAGTSSVLAAVLPALEGASKKGTAIQARQIVCLREAISSHLIAPSDPVKTCE